MKNKLIAKLLSFGLLACATANAATIAGTGIIDGAGGDTLIVDNSGAKVASGFAGAGYFTIDDATVATLATSFESGSVAALQTLVSSFVSLASDNFQTGAEGFFGTAVPGGYVLGADLGLIGAASPVIGKSLYTFFGNGATLAGSLQVALVLHTGVTITRDDNVATPDSNDLGLNNPYQRLIAGEAITNTTFDATALGGTPGTAAAAIQLVPAIPEPSVALLGLLGAVGFFRRRR